MITRFRLEAAGISKNEIERQFSLAIDQLFGITRSYPDEWERTDDVCYKDGSIYRGRVVMKFKKAL